jgi:helix-hairpin-helix protein
MDDFLHFLNTADIDSLTQLPGISRSLAENLIAARPFDSIDDCLEVRGMGKNLLSRAMSAYETWETEPEEIDGHSVEQEAMPIEKSQLMAKSVPENKPSFGSRVRQTLLNVFRAVLRLILLALLIILVVSAIYYGVPYLTEKFIEPVQQNTARVSELEAQIADLQTQIAEISRQLTEMNNRTDEVERAVEAHTASIEKLEGIQTTLEKQIKENADKTLLKLQHEVMLTRVLDTLSRARLYLAQSNFGLAKEDVQSARDLLVELQTDPDDEILTQTLKRLDAALTNLPAFPVVASGDLEIAWQILMTGEVPATPTPEPTSTDTPAPALPPETTATPTATP